MNRKIILERVSNNIYRVTWMDGSISVYKNLFECLESIKMQFEGHGF